MNDEDRVKEISRKNSEYSEIISKKLQKIHELNGEINLTVYGFLNYFDNKLSFFIKALCERDRFIYDNSIINGINFDLNNEEYFSKELDISGLFKIINETEEFYAEFVSNDYKSILYEDVIKPHLMENFLKIQNIIDKLYNKKRWLWYDTTYNSFDFRN